MTRGGCATSKAGATSKIHKTSQRFKGLMPGLF